MTIHLLPINRAVSRQEAEERALFLAKHEVSVIRDTPVWQLTVEQLARSSNAAIATEAARLLGGAS